MAGTDINLLTSAIWTIYEAEAGSWPLTAKYLEKYGEPLSAALCWKVAHEKSKSPKVQRALYKGGYIEHIEVTQPVPVCPLCGEVHQRLKSCATIIRKDRRKTRAWHGPAERAKKVDEMVESLGFGSLSQMIDCMIDSNVVEILGE